MHIQIAQIRFKSYRENSCE